MFAAPAAKPTPVLMHIVQQHGEEAALLRHSRSLLVRAPHVGLLLLGRHDERVEAHLDGLLVAGAAAKDLLQAQLAEDEGRPSAGALFAAAVLALRQRDHVWLDALLAQATVPAARAAWRGLASAFGWVAADALQGVVRRLLASDQPLHRALAIDACRMHRVDPGAALAAALLNADAALRTSALRAAAALARHDLLPAVHAAIADSEPDVAVAAACAACQLGERSASMRVLTAVAHGAAAGADTDTHTSCSAEAVLALLLTACTADAAQETARNLAAAAQSRPTAAAQRRLVRALALLGDPRHVPWLLDRMQDPALARLAGEAFGWITGVDLAAAQLEQLEAPADAPATGPSDDPADDDVALDDDRDLPWPDVAKVRAHWQRSPVAGERLFMGRPQADAAALGAVLRHGTQRQRRHAALLLTLVQPGQTLLPVAAPAWRQQRWLAAAG